MKRTVLWLIVAQAIRTSASRTSAHCLSSALRSASPNRVATVRAAAIGQRGWRGRGPMYLVRFDEPPRPPNYCWSHAQAS